jgi:hypothetical protein
MKIHTIALYLLIVAAIVPQISPAQTLDYNNKVEIALNDGLNIVLYGKAPALGSTALSGEYYYLPTNIRLSKREDGVPKFLFIKYTTDAKETNGGVQGALMHFMMEWGLTTQQEQELQSKLEQKLQSSAGGVRPVVKGPVELESGENSFSIISASLSDEKSAKIMHTGRAPAFPGATLAASIKMDKYAAQLMSTTLEKTRSISDLSLKLDLKYKLLTPSVQGRITFDWSKLEQMTRSVKDEIDVEKKRVSSGFLSLWSSNQIQKITRTQVDSLKKLLLETKVVKVEIEKYQENSAIADKLIEHFTEMFINSIADRSSEGLPATTPTESADEPVKDADIRHSWSINKSKLESKLAKKIETFDLALRTTISYPVTIVGNLSDWYNGVRHNQACVTSVNLADPFFQHRDIRFILDLEAEQIFQQEVNYVTVYVRKTRSSGDPFTEDITIDRDYLKKTGTQASVTYARNGDNSNDTYEYRMQWSLKGNIRYPENPPWLRGEWQGVTLGAPVTPRTIEFEGDLEQLKLMQISRAVLQVRYKKFGQETESEIPLSAAGGQPIVQKMILVDRDTQGYAYRMVFTHKTEGKLALDWSAKINDGYVYASIPEQFNDKTSAIFQKAAEAGKVIAAGTGSEKVVQKGTEVLEKFKDIYKVITK